jgi:hypothetical protein
MSRLTSWQVTKAAGTAATCLFWAISAGLLLYAFRQVADLLYSKYHPVWVLAKACLSFALAYALWRGSSAFTSSLTGRLTAISARADALLGWIFVGLLATFGLGYLLRPEVIDSDERDRMTRAAFLAITSEWWAPDGPRYVRIAGSDPSPAELDGIGRAVALEPWSKHPRPGDCLDAGQVRADIYSCSPYGVETWVAYADWPFWRVATIRWGASDCGGGAVLIRASEWRVIRTWMDLCGLRTTVIEEP